jgi:CRP/FNR family cyclic AMP-dependent transcriptional regulator
MACSVAESSAKRQVACNHIGMRSPYGLDIIESCLGCKLREDYLFCNLSPVALRTLDSIKSIAAYPAGAVLFLEGQPARGIFVLCNGRAKLSTSSADGKTIILRIAEAGEVLGLSATVSGKPYEVTAETLEPSQANFVNRSDFLNFLRGHGDAALRIAEELSNNYHAAYSEVRALGLSTSASEKLSRLLLEWSDKGKRSGENLRVTVSLTHEEIAQLIGVSRETVTRSFGELKRKQLIQVKGSTLIIRDKAALQKLVSS